MENIVRAHAASYRIIHRLQPQALVGVAHTYRIFLPRTAWSPLDRMVVPIYSNLYNEFFPRALSTGVLRFPGLETAYPRSEIYPGLPGDQLLHSWNSHRKPLQAEKDGWGAGLPPGQRFERA